MLPTVKHIERPGRPRVRPPKEVEARAGFPTMMQITRGLTAALLVRCRGAGEAQGLTVTDPGGRVPGSGPRVAAIATPVTPAATTATPA